MTQANNDVTKLLTNTINNHLEITVFLRIQN